MGGRGGRRCCGALMVLPTKKVAGFHGAQTQQVREHLENTVRTQHTCGTVVRGKPAHLRETPSLLMQPLLLPLRIPPGPHPAPSKQPAFAQETIGLFEGPVAEKIATHEVEGEKGNRGGLS